MLVKCICRNCAGHLEFEEENAGTTIACPHCRFETTLFLPGTDEAEAQETAVAGKRRLRQRLLWAGGILLLGGLGFALYKWGIPQVEDHFPSIDSRVAHWLILLASVVLALLALSWLVLPVVFFFQFRKLLRLLGRIEVHSRRTAMVETDQDEAEEEPTAQEEPKPAPSHGKDEP